MLWAHSLCSANGTAGENAMCTRQVMWLPLLGGSLLAAAAWEEQPTPSNLRIFDGWQLGRFCVMSTYKTFSFAFSILKASVCADFQGWSCWRQDLSLSSVTFPASFCLWLFSSSDVLTGWMGLYTLCKLRKAILVKGSIQSIQHCGLRGIRSRTGNEDVLHLYQ